MLRETAASGRPIGGAVFRESGSQILTVDERDPAIAGYLLQARPAVITVAEPVEAP